MKIKVDQGDMICNLRYIRICDYAFAYTGHDNHQTLKVINYNRSFIKQIKEINNGDRKIITLYCKVDFLKLFFELCKKINKKIILISGCSDIPITKEIFNSKPDNIIKWYGENIMYIDKNLVPLPMGSISATWIGNDKDKTELYNHKTFKLKEIDNKDPVIRNLCFMCFTLDTNLNHRKRIYDYFSKKNWVTNLCKENTGKYLNDDIFMDNVYNHHFVISPLGNGIDCGRTWTTLQLGSIPIIPYLEVFEDWEKNLPIILYKNLEEITEQFLLKKLEEIKKKNYTYDYLKTNYWKNKWENDKKYLNEFSLK